MAGRVLSAKGTAQARLPACRAKPGGFSSPSRICPSHSARGFVGHSLGAAIAGALWRVNPRIGATCSWRELSTSTVRVPATGAGSVIPAVRHDEFTRPPMLWRSSHPHASRRQRGDRPVIMHLMQTHSTTAVPRSQLTSLCAEAVLPGHEMLLRGQRLCYRAVRLLIRRRMVFKTLIESGWSAQTAMMAMMAGAFDQPDLVAAGHRRRKGKL